MMKKKTTTSLLALAFFIIVILIGYLYFHTRYPDISPNVATELSSNVNLSLIKIDQGTDEVVYTYQITNNTPYLIKQNNVYLSFDITEENTVQQNNFKIEGRGNKLNFSPHDTVQLTFIVPKKIMDISKPLLSDQPSLEMKLYLNEVKQDNFFHITLVNKSSQ